ncbi:MAG: molybdopterin-dependent oxidoreductase, partial [Pseudomonadota bacterium]
AAILGHAMALAEEGGAKLMVLHTAAARVGGLDIGFARADGLACLDGAGFVWNLGADECEMPEGAFVVYQGHHGDRGAHRADVILPGAAYTEQPGLFVNTEGRVQMAVRAGFPPGDAKEDWAILRAVSAELGQTLPFNRLDDLRAQLFDAHPHLAEIDQIAEAEWQPVPAGEMDRAPIQNVISDHYLTNPISRASQMMAEMSRLAQDRTQAMAAE